MVPQSPAMCLQQAFSSLVICENESRQLSVGAAVRQTTNTRARMGRVHRTCQSYARRPEFKTEPGIPGSRGWPIQAVFRLEWGICTLGQIFPSTRSRFLAAHSDSIATRPSQPVEYCRKLLHSQSSGRTHNPRFTGLR